MAGLQQINGTYYISFRFGGRPFRPSLKTTDATEAEAAKLQVILTLHRIKIGMLPPPSAEADVALYIISGGKIEQKLILPDPPPAPESLQVLWETYRDSFPAGAKDSLPTEHVHFRHLFRILGEHSVVRQITTQDLQRYINLRLKEPGRRGRTVAPDTVRGEIETLTHVWNTFARPRKIVQGLFDEAFGELNFGKRRSRYPFQTWEQIEQRLDRRLHSESQTKEVWDSLFLDLDRIAALLDFVRDRTELPTWAYPKFVFAAHTGARRSEMIRSEIDDWDFENMVVQIREKKRDADVEFTFRHVAISPFLAEVMLDWRSRHPGGVCLFCNEPNKQLTTNDSAKAFRRAVKGSEWNVLLGWHLFRHSLASNMARKGIDQRMIDATLGHQTEDMRRRYRHLFPNQQREVMASIFAKR